MGARAWTVPRRLSACVDGAQELALTTALAWLFGSSKESRLLLGHKIATRCGSADRAATIRQALLDVESGIRVGGGVLSK